MSQQVIFDRLNQLGIHYTAITHPPVYTVAEAKALCNLDGHGCKNLFLYDKKVHHYYLVVMEESKKAHTNTIRKQIKSSSISFGSEEDLLRLLGTTPGSVSPLGILHDTDHHITILIDEDLPNCDKVCFHPNDNTATLAITYTDLIKYLEYHQAPYQFVSVVKPE
ncbi:MAG: prolyl-tRNA synthetase associated domain-containing protein [Cellulosilyticaceae bacterium]